MEDLFKIREKGQYETYTEYLDWINQQIEKQNNVLIQKNSEISELKAQLANLEAEKAKTEKTQSDSILTKTEIDLRAIIDDLNKVLNDNKNYKNDSRIDVLISKVDEAIMKYTNIEKEYDDIKAELSKPVNTGYIQEYIKRQAELESLIKDVYENVKLGKEEILETIKNNEKNNAVSEINNMEQAINLVSNQDIEPDKDVPYAKPMNEQINNFEQQMNNEVEKDQTNDINDSFTQTMNSENDVNLSLNDVTPVAPTIDVGQPSVIPFVNNSETITPDASVLDSVVPQEVNEVPQEQVDNNVIEETNNQEVISSEEQVNLVPDGAQKVESVEEVSPEYMNSVVQAYDISNTKATKQGVANSNNIGKKATMDVDVKQIDKKVIKGFEPLQAAGRTR